MKRILRNIFSGYFLVLLLLLAEILLILALQFLINGYLSLFTDDLNNHVAAILVYLGIRLIFFIISLFIFFKIVNRPEDPEFKIPWIVVMLLLPFFASILFLIFGSHGIKKKDQKIINASQEIYHNIITKNEIKDETNGTFNYLSSTTGLSLHQNNKINYYKNGETFFPDLIDCLKEAKEFIFMEFFIISDGEIWSQISEILKQKADEGVEVRLIYDDMGCGGTITSLTPKLLAKHGIKCYKFHPFRLFLSSVYNNRDHRKIAIIDHKYGFTGGMNLADEYANIIKRFGYWKDSMIKIQGSSINNLIMMFLQNYDIASKQISDYAKYLNHDYEKYDDEGFVMPFHDGPGAYVDALVGEQNYINIINYAKKELYISTPYLIPTYSLLDALRNASLRGVDVHLILPYIPDKKIVYSIAKSHFPYLLKAGVKIHFYKPGFNHMKSIIADKELAFVGTINFDFRSLVHHFECGATIYKNSCLFDIQKDFDEMIEQSILVSQDFKLKLITRTFCSVVKIFTPLL